MRYAMTAALAALALAGCGDAPDGGGQHEAATYVRDYVSACRDRGGIMDSQTDNYHGQPAYVICEDWAGFVYKDGRLVQVDLSPTVAPEGRGGELTGREAAAKMLRSKEEFPWRDS